jgi:hypothetical protein
MPHLGFRVRRQQSRHRKNHRRSFIRTKDSCESRPAECSSGFIDAFSSGSANDSFCNSESIVFGAIACREAISFHAAKFVCARETTSRASAARERKVSAAGNTLQKCR